MQFEMVYSDYIVGSRPSKKKLLTHVVTPVSAHWYDLGVTLLKEEQESHLDVIKADHGSDKKTCCKEMFWYWLDTNTEASWQQLIDALRSPAVELPVVAANLKQILIGSCCCYNCCYCTIMQCINCLLDIAV